MLKIKIIAKYTTNLLGMISTLILGLNAIDGITIPYCRQIIDVIVLLLPADNSSKISIKTSFSLSPNSSMGTAFMA